jgi:hypothetical protein
MFVVGAASGVINYFTLGPKQSLESCLLRRCITLGVLMMFLVPFILSIFGGTFIEDSEGNPAACLAKPAPPLTLVDMLQHQLQQL